MVMPAYTPGIRSERVLKFCASLLKWSFGVKRQTQARVGIRHFRILVSDTVNRVQASAAKIILRYGIKLCQQCPKPNVFGGQHDCRIEPDRRVIEAALYLINMPDFGSNRRIVRLRCLGTG